MELDCFNDYLSDATATGRIDAGDVGSLIALAILEAKGNYPLAMAALEKAKSAVLECPAIDGAADAFDSAIHHLEEFEAHKAMFG